MNEQELTNKFYEFLEKEKNYPSKSLLRQAPAFAINGQRIQPDLLILDTRIGEYIGLIEFKENINPNVKKSVKARIENYIKILKNESLPYYLVFPLNNEDFQILVIGNENEWVSISKKEFPEFETLSAKKKIEEKEIEKNIEKELVIELENKKRNKAKLSLWTLTSLIAGILTVVISFYTSNKLDNNDNLLIEKTKLEIQILKERIAKLDSLETLVLPKSEITFIKDSSATFVGIEKRLSIIENGLLNNPKKTLQIENIYDEINLLGEKIGNQNELTNLKNENLKAKVELLNALVLGMILALFGSAIGFVITNYNERKNNR
jgi:cell division protein FtsL